MLPILDENLIKTKAFREQMDMHAEILFGDGKETLRNRKPVRARFNGMRVKIGKFFHMPNRKVSHQQPNLPTAK